MSKKITMIVNSTINSNEPEALEHYTKNAGAILKAHKGKLVAKYTDLSSITENSLQNNIMIMQFDDEDIINALSNGAEYHALLPYRDKAFSHISISFTQSQG